jgi:hypothetical protein
LPDPLDPLPLAQVFSTRDLLTSILTFLAGPERVARQVRQASILNWDSPIMAIPRAVHQRLSMRQMTMMMMMMI